MTPGVKHDQAKPRYSLLPWRALAAVVEVLEAGARKYSDHNWQRVEPLEDRYFDALMRHLTAWRLGERQDPYGGHPHMASVVCCALFLLAKEVGFDQVAPKARAEAPKAEGCCGGICRREAEAAAQKKEGHPPLSVDAASAHPEGTEKGGSPSFYGSSPSAELSCATCGCGPAPAANAHVGVECGSTPLAGERTDGTPPFHKKHAFNST